jgi:2,4-dienoyl-CoA reductase-like NADH-dependent reductase (Old Yellow Enzyme family)
MTNGMATWNNKKIFFLGVNTGYVTDGLPDSRYVEFYRQRSSAALHCAIIGNVVVPGGYGSNDATPTLTSNSVWREVAAGIVEAGSLPGIQLATSWAGYAGTRKFVGNDPASVIESARALVEGLGSAEQSNVIDSFELASSMAVDHGFRHVQLHGAHGYLLSLLIDGRINPRSEEALSRLSRLIESLLSNKVETSFRISLLTGYSAFDEAGAQSFHDRIVNLPFDYFDLSSGFYNIDKRLIYPSRPDIISARHAITMQVAKRHPTKRFILSGRATRATVETQLDNVHIGICRDLIANPSFLTQRERGCENRSKCHYFSRGEASVRCALWDDVERL